MIERLLEIESFGETIEEAVEKSLLQLRCTRAEVQTTIVQAPSSGLFGLIGSRQAQVKVRLTDRAVIARVICGQLLKICGFDCTVDVHLESERIHLNIEGNESSLIIGRHGQTLEALQSIVVLLTDRHVSDRTPVVLDIDNYRVRRERSLERLARRLASQVRRTGRAVLVPPLPPEERKVFHLSIRKEDGVDSRSLGEGYERKIVVSSSKG